MSAVAVAFVVCLAGFAAIGVSSARRMQRTTDDYLVADRAVPAWLVALSAVSTNNSGYMFIGLIGFTFAFGLSSIWLSVGWLLGDWLAWFVVHRRLREQSEAQGVASIPSFVGGRGLGEHSRALTVACGLLTLVFLGIYAAAQLKAGSKALHVLFGWDLATGAWLGAAVVALYCFSGGIRASIWTDAAQSMVMIAAMGLLTLVAAREHGAPWTLPGQLADLSPALVAWVPPDAQAGLALYVLSWVGAGLAVVGQPHIMIRAMTLDDPSHMRRTRNAYFAWYVPFVCLTVLVGLYARVAFDAGAFDAELALPRMALDLLPQVLVGLVLAALFAATMSTADSQILSCSAALTQDIFPRLRRSYAVGKVATLAVTLFALAIALRGPGSVFDLVVLAWSALGASLGPLIVVRVLRRPLPPAVGIAMMLAAVGTVLAWRALGYSDSVYEVLPAATAAAAVYLAGLRLAR